MTATKAAEQAPESWSTGAGARVFAQDGYTDSHLITQFASQNRAIARHAGEWFIWDGKRWEAEADGKAYHLARDLVGALFLKASAEKDDAKRVQIGKGATAAAAQHRLMSIVAGAENLLAYPRDAFDDPRHTSMLLNARNGTLDLRTGALRPHNPDDGITRLIDVDFDSYAKAPRFEAFLSQIFAGDADLIAYVQRVFGYCLTGDVGEHAIFVFHGAGSNGKTTLVNTMHGVLGEYAATLSPKTLMVKRSEGENSPELARMPGARLASSTESTDGAYLNEGLIKQLAGSDRIVATAKYKAPVDFVPQFKLILSTNHRPKIRGREHAIWRRIRLIPFTVEITPAERILNFDQRLIRDEGPGILAWAVRGCLEWQKRGLAAPAAVRAATATYKTDEDVLGQFIGDECEVGEGLIGTGVFEAYTRWCEDNNEKRIRNQAFSRIMAERGYQQRKLASGMAWLGIALKGVEDMQYRGPFYGSSPIEVPIGALGKNPSSPPSPALSYTVPTLAASIPTQDAPAGSRNVSAKPPIYPEAPGRSTAPQAPQRTAPSGTPPASVPPRPGNGGPPIVESDLTRRAREWIEQSSAKRPRRVGV